MKIVFSVRHLFLSALFACAFSLLAHIAYASEAEELTVKANQGDLQAQLELGRIYFGGLDVPQDYQQSFTWYSKAADQDDAEAQYNLGTMYFLGKGVAKDDQQAIAWYTKAAAQGHANAQYNLGAIYAGGLAVPQDFKQAYVWLSLASASGHLDSTKAREIVAEMLTPQALSEAQKEVKALSDQINARKS